MIIELLLLLLALLAFWGYQLNRKMDYWQKLGLKVPSATPVIGSNPFFCWDLIAQKKNVNDIVISQYNEMKGEKLTGFQIAGEDDLLIDVEHCRCGGIDEFPAQSEATSDVRSQPKCFEWIRFKGEGDRSVILKLVFSFDPLCQGLCGSQKYTSISVSKLNR